MGLLVQWVELNSTNRYTVNKEPNHFDINSLTMFCVLIVIVIDRNITLLWQKDYKINQQVLFKT